MENGVSHGFRNTKIGFSVSEIIGIRPLLERTFEELLDFAERKEEVGLSYDGEVNGVSLYKKLNKSGINCFVGVGVVNASPEVETLSHFEN
jgi:hypothetical protein